MTTALVTYPECSTTNRIPAAASGRPRCGKCGKDLPWVVEAGDTDFAAVAEKSPVPALVDFWAAWCGPCRMVSPAGRSPAGGRPAQLAR